jgi:hypothetical protein
MQKLIDSKPATVWPPICPLPEAEIANSPFSGPDGSMGIGGFECYAQRYEGHNVLDWNDAYVSGLRAGLVSGSYLGSYGKADIIHRINALIERFKASIVGKATLVIGSEAPWLEGLLLNAGAKSVFTFEYSTIQSSHPGLFAREPRQVAAEVIAGTFEPVDLIISFSSIEHSGLGRYGDALNPDGDLEAMQQAWCMLKPGGLNILGVPMACNERGQTVFNAHRIYGFSRLRYIGQDYKLVAYHDKERCDVDALAIYEKPLAT